MKPIALLLLAFTAATAHAGSFGGPPPFTNGSPLESGVDGNYQASARGSNLSGVITFAYASGVQTTVATQNRWVIFSEGQVFSGTPTVAINDGTISGVLETSTTFPVTRTSSITGGTSDVLTSLTGASGYFNGKLDNNSPTGSFKGKGALAAIFTRTVTVGTTVTVTTETISAPFKVKGVRAHTGS